MTHSSSLVGTAGETEGPVQPVAYAPLPRVGVRTWLTTGRAGGRLDILGVWPADSLFSQAEACTCDGRVGRRSGDRVRVVSSSVEKGKILTREGVFAASCEYLSATCGVRSFPSSSLGRACGDSAQPLSAIRESASPWLGSFSGVGGAEELLLDRFARPRRDVIRGGCQLENVFECQRRYLLAAGAGGMQRASPNGGIRQAHEDLSTTTCRQRAQGRASRCRARFCS